jgi:hypothetical protein
MNQYSSPDYVDVEIPHAAGVAPSHWQQSPVTTSNEVYPSYLSKQSPPHAQFRPPLTQHNNDLRFQWWCRPSRPPSIGQCQRWISTTSVRPYLRGVKTNTALRSHSQPCRTRMPLYRHRCKWRRAQRREPTTDRTTTTTRVGSLILSQ